MSYNDLNTIKKINGIPADLRYHERIIENDSFFKSEVDSDEKLSAFNEDIIPVFDATYNVGSVSKKINNIYCNTLNSSLVEVASGSLAAPSLKIGLAGLASLASGELSFIGSSGIESVKMMTSGFLVKAANDSQFKIQNTNPATPGSWSIGADNVGLKLYDNNFGASLKVIFGLINSTFLNPIIAPAYSGVTPAFSFSGDSSSGLFKNTDTQKVGLSFLGESKLEINQTSLVINAEHSSLNNLKANGSFSLEKNTISSPGLSQEIDVSEFSKIMIDTSAGDIEIAGFTGGIEGQMLYIYNKNPINTFTLVFDSLSATQKILLKGSVNYVISNDYGGITLTFDDGVWREVSRS